MLGVRESSQTGLHGGRYIHSLMSVITQYVISYTNEN